MNNDEAFQNIVQIIESVNASIHNLTVAASMLSVRVDVLANRVTDLEEANAPIPPYK